MCHIGSLPFTLKSILRQKKEELGKFKYFTMQKNLFFKKILWKKTKIFLTYIITDMCQNWLVQNDKVVFFLMPIQIGYFKLYWLIIIKPKNSIDVSIIFFHFVSFYFFLFFYFSFLFYSKVWTIWLVILIGK